MSTLNQICRTFQRVELHVQVRRAAFASGHKLINQLLNIRMFWWHRLILKRDLSDQFGGQRGSDSVLHSVPPSYPDSSSVNTDARVVWNKLSVSKASLSSWRWFGRPPPSLLRSKTHFSTSSNFLSNDKWLCYHRQRWVSRDSFFWLCCRCRSDKRRTCFCTEPNKKRQRVKGDGKNTHAGSHCGPFGAA